MIWSLLILTLLQPFAWSGETKFSPRISYLEDRIEKDVDWPVEVTVVSPEDAAHGPVLSLKIRIPPLLHLRGKDSHFRVKSQFGSQFLEVDVNHPISVIRLDKIDGSPESVHPISLRISFPENFGFVKLSQQCLRRFRPPGPLETRLPVPLVTYVYCPSLDKIVFKSTPEVEFSQGKKQLHFSSFEEPFNAQNSLEKIVIKRTLVKDNIPGEFKLVLASAGDVLERFEQPNDEVEKVPTSDRFQYFAGFNVSEDDPEIYGGLDYKKEEWRSYLTTAGLVSVPALVRGNSIRNLVDGALTLAVNHPLTALSAPPGAVIGGGILAIQRSAAEFLATDVIWGPTFHLSLLKAHQFSANSYLGLLFSTAFLTSGRAFESQFNQIYHLETRWSLALPHGQLVEPHLKVQHLKFEQKRSFDVTLFKVGVGVRW